MKFRGGYDVRIEGRPGSKVEMLPEPEALYLPLRSRRFVFSDVLVQEGQHVAPGQSLAKDPTNYSVPLLAPRAGTVRLDAAQDHIVLENITKVSEEPPHPDEDILHVPRDMGSVGIKRYRLLALGAWQFLQDAHTGQLPDPFGTPRAVIVSTLHLEPFLARGDVQLHQRLSSFTRGLEHLQSLLEYQPIYLVLPDIQSAFASQVREILRGYAWVKMVQIPLRYPCGDFAVLARALGYGCLPDEPVWAVRAEGILAIDRALTLERSCTVRIISLGGPMARSPIHLKAVPGYPIKNILTGRLDEGETRVIDGGALTGRVVGADQVGIDSECAGLTVIAEQTEREFLGFVRPGWDRRSYSRCFLSLLRRPFTERLTTGIRGEGRPCISCGFCEEVCPAGIMPHRIHKLFYQDEIEEAERTRVDLCVECGLCSFVCPSKIDLRQEFIDGKETIRQELHAEAEAEVEA